MYNSALLSYQGNSMNLEKNTGGMFHVLITSMHAGDFATSVVSCNSEAEANTIVANIKKLKSPEFVSHFAERLN